jgi:hypothetical protein
MDGAELMGRTAPEKGREKIFFSRPRSLGSTWREKLFLAI